MTLKEKIAFGLYAATAIAIVAEATVVIVRDVKHDRKLKKNLEKIAEESEKKN
jgi:hypothetical protein